MNVIDPTRTIYCDSYNGPIFGDNHFDSADIYIANNANTNQKSFTNLGNNFNHLEYDYSSIEAQSFLAESENFLLKEIEIYIKS
jgi:hypothetical protein